MASIGDILMAQGRHAAESRRARAGAWQPLMQHLASIPGQVMQDRDAEREAEEQAFDRQQQREVRGQQIEAGNRAATAADATAEQKQQMNEILASDGVLGPDQTINAQRAHALAQAKGYTEILDDILGLATEHNAAVGKGLREQTQFEQQQADRRQTTNQQGVRRMIGESIVARGDQPMTPQDARTYQGMALQEGIELPKGVLPEPEEEVSMVIKGPNGRPTRVMVPKSRLRTGGVEEYREPKSETGQRSPIWVMKDGKFIDLAGVAPPGSQPASSREQGRAVTSGDAGDLAELDSSLDDLNTLGREMGTTGAGSWAESKIPDVITSWTGWGADAKSRQGTIDRVKQVIGKALEGGVLRKEDEVKYEKILPKLADAPAVAATKLQGLWRAIEKKKQTRLDALGDAGYDIAKFAVRPKREREGAPDKTDALLDELLGGGR